MVTIFLVSTIHFLDYDKKINIVDDSIQVLIEESDMHPNLKI